MPNHVTNSLLIDGERAEEIKEKIKNVSPDGEVLPIDFNKIVEQPEELNATRGSMSMLANSIIQEQKETGKSLKEIVLERSSEISSSPNEPSLQVYFKNYEKYGVTDWWDWRIKYWGTKWNAYETAEAEDRIIFNTAWSTPYAVIEALSKQYPEAEFEVSFADEDLGSNCGRYRLKAGELIEEFIPDGEAAFEYACEMWGYDPDEIRAEREEDA